MVVSNVESAGVGTGAGIGGWGVVMWWSLVWYVMCCRMVW